LADDGLWTPNTSTLQGDCGDGSDATFISTIEIAEVQFALGTISGSPTSTTATLYVRARKLGGGSTPEFYVDFSDKNGTFGGSLTQLVSATSFTEYSVALSGMTGWTSGAGDLNSFVRNTGAGTASLQIADVWVSIPDNATSGPRLLSLTGVGT
jgi:hypothetical protein